MVACKKVSIHLFWKRQNPADSDGTGSNLNCRCVIVFSLFFEKIIFRYTSSYFFRDPTKYLQYYTTRYERSFPPFWPYFETGTRNSKKNQKDGNPSQCVIICDLVTIKNNKLGIRQISFKSVLRNELSCTKIRGFHAKWRMLWPVS